MSFLPFCRYLRPFFVGFLGVKMGSTDPSFLRTTVQSKVFPALDLQPLSETAFPSRRDAACPSVNFLVQKPNSLNPQPATSFQVPSSCFSFLMEEQA